MTMHDEGGVQTEQMVGLFPGMEMAAGETAVAKANAGDIVAASVSTQKRYVTVDAFKTYVLHVVIAGSGPDTSYLVCDSAEEAMNEIHNV